MGGNFHLKLNIDSRPIENKYREGKVKRTLERELTVPEIANREANETSLLRRDWRRRSGRYFSVTVRGLGCWKRLSMLLLCVNSQHQLGIR